MSSLIDDERNLADESSLSLIDEEGRKLYVLSENEKKAEFLLKFHPTMITIIRDYEKVESTKQSSLSQDDISNAYGQAGHEHGRELYRDVTANTVVLKHKRAAIYSLYKQLSEIIHIVIDSIVDQQAKTIAQMLFIKGVRHKETLEYLSKGYSSKLGVIPASTFAYKRRLAIREISASLEILGILELILKNEGAGRCKKLQYRINLEEWSAFEE
jgi:hypothetical protein